MPPTLFFTYKQYGKNFKPLEEDKIIPGRAQFFHAIKGEWVMSTFWTRNKQKNTGKQLYRIPSSFLGYIEIIPQYIIKFFKYHKNQLIEFFIKILCKMAKH